jgi:hypothetical protein
VTDPIVPEGEMENDSVKVSVTKALKDNLKTDGKFCNFPSSEVRLLIPEDKAVFKRQYKIPLVYQKIITDQVQKWLKEGVIERAKPGCRWNNPLTTAPKKGSD